MISSLLNLQSQDFYDFLEDIFYICLIVLISNYFFPFFYGVSDNREEIPAIFYINSLALYSNDEYIKLSVTEFNVATPYLYFISCLSKYLSLSMYPVLFFTLLQITLISIFITAKNIFKLFSSNFSYFFFFLSFIALEMLLLNFPYLIFGGRWFFSNYFDPQFLSYSMCFLSILFFFKEKYFLATLFLFFANLFSPLLSLPIYFAYSFVIFSLFFFKQIRPLRFFQVNILFFLSIFPYSVFLFFKTQNNISELDPQKIMSLVRSTDLSRIPHLFDLNFNDLYFIIFLFFLIVFTFLFVLMRVNLGKKQLSIKNIEINKLKKEFNLNFLLFILFLTSYLLIFSVVSSLVYIPFLYRLDPYRISVILVPIMFFFCCANFFHYLNLKKIHNKLLFFLSPLSLVFIIYLAINNFSYISSKSEGDENNYNSTEVFIDAKEVINWVKKNTSESDTFINYTDSKNVVTLRTHAKRSTFFSWKTINLTNSGLVRWYERLLINYGIEKDPSDYRGIRSFIGNKARNINEVDISYVINQIDYNINYILAPKAFVLKNNKFNIIFENNSYIVYKNNN